MPRFQTVIKSARFVYSQCNPTADFVRDTASTLDRLQAGVEIMTERDSKPVAVLRSAAAPGRKLSEIAAALPADSTDVLDFAFEKDVDALIKSNREPANAPEWRSRLVAVLLGYSHHRSRKSRAKCAANC